MPHDEAMELEEEAAKNDRQNMFRQNSGKKGRTFPDYNPSTPKIHCIKLQQPTYEDRLRFCNFAGCFQWLQLPRCKVNNIFLMPKKMKEIFEKM